MILLALLHQKLHFLYQRFPKVYRPITNQRTDGAATCSVLNLVEDDVVSEYTFETTLAALSVGATIPIPIAIHVAVMLTA